MANMNENRIWKVLKYRKGKSLNEFISLRQNNDTYIVSFKIEMVNNPPC